MYLHSCESYYEDISLDFVFLIEPKSATIAMLNVLALVLCLVVPTFSSPINLQWSGAYSTSRTWNGQLWDAKPCDLEPRCICISNKGVNSFHCEGEIHVEMHAFFQTGYIVMYCNSTLPSTLLIHDYKRINKLHKYRKYTLEVVGCPEPPGEHSYYSIIFQTMESQTNVSTFSIDRLTLDCRSRREFYLHQSHILHLTELEELIIDCPALKELPEDLFHGTVKNLEILTIMRSNLEDLADYLFSKLSRLVKLNLSINGIRLIKRYALHGLVSLKKLDMGHNEISLIQEGAFDSVRNLEIFDLRKNRLTETPTCLVSFSKLIKCDLSYNHISEVRAERFEGLGSLQQLFLQSNSIRYVDSNLATHLKNLRVLDLSGNYLSQIPNPALNFHGLQLFYFNDNALPIPEAKTFITSEHLSALDARNSSIGSISRDFLHGMPGIFYFDMSSNSIDQLDVDVFARCPHVSTIYLQQNKIRELPDGIFSENALLNYLNLSVNALTTLPASLFANATMMEILDISYNSITHLPQSLFSNLKTLTYLTLSRNRLKTLEGNAFRGVISLDKLDLSWNNISVLPVDIFSQFRVGDSKLEFVLLQGNELERLPSLQMPTLRSLNAAGNKLTQLDPDTFHKTPGLEELNLSNNKLTDLPQSFLGANKKVENKLSRLDLSFNLLQNVPHEFLSDAHYLKFLDLSGNQIEKVNVNSFINCRSLTHLDLSNNNMSHLVYENESGGVIDLESLADVLPIPVKFLNLSDNLLDFKYAQARYDFDRKTWGKVSTLELFQSAEVILLAKNNIEKIFLDWRTNLPILRHLDLRQNKLKYIKHQELMFSSTKIRRNGTEKYPCDHSLTVDLRYNLIQGLELPPEMFRKSSSNDVYSHATILLDNNPFACGCELGSFLRLLDGDIVLTSELERTEGRDWVLPAKIDAGNLSCWYPVTMRGRKLVEVESWVNHFLLMFGICSVEEL